jgi:hypothetical protein
MRRSGAGGGRQGRTWVGFRGGDEREPQRGDWNGTAALRGRPEAAGGREILAVTSNDFPRREGYAWWADWADFAPGPTL